MSLHQILFESQANCSRNPCKNSVGVVSSLLVRHKYFCGMCVSGRNLTSTVSQNVTENLRAFWFWIWVTSEPNLSPGSVGHSWWWELGWWRQSSSSNFNCDVLWWLLENMRKAARSVLRKPVGSFIVQCSCLHCAQQPAVFGQEQRSCHPFSSLYNEFGPITFFLFSELRLKLKKVLLWQWNGRQSSTTPLKWISR